MPKNTKVHRCVDAVKKKGHDESSAIAICQSATGQSYQTGKSKRESDGKPIGSPKSESSFEARLSRILTKR